MTNEQVINYESGRIIFGENEAFYRENSAISNSDLSLVANDPALVEWNRKIGNSEDLISSSIKEGKLFHKLLLETDFWHKAKLEPTSYHKGCRLIERIAEVKGDCVETYTDRVFTTITGLRNQLKKDGFNVKTTSDIDECLKVIAENRLDYRFIDTEIENADALGYDFLTADQITKFFCMIESLMENGDFKKLYDSAWYGEVSLYLNALEFTYNLPLKGRVDLMTTYNGRHYLVDIKTISSIDNVQRNVYEYHYFRQAAFYKYLYCQLLKVESEQVDFIFAFVETSPKLGKYRSLLAKVSDEHLQQGLEQMNSLLTVYSEYLNRDKNELNFAVL